MTKKFSFQIKELHALHASLRVAFVFLLLLTACILAYMGVRHGYPLAVVYLDLDGFKQVNDTYGHEAGNEVLRGVSQMLRGHLRGEDFIGRLGGDEFLIVLPHTDESGALVVGERLRAKLAALEFAAPGGQRIDSVGFSMGVASYPAHGDTREQLIQAADQAMYRAKKSGGDRVCL